ncbi:ABC-type Fe3+-siderophore transport system, peripl asmic iron-binding component [Devosia sp. DBB001]|nr:ABC-type Fe3+-siderophore transport system, peripl asmic iron-binding component [Devosia sp. DBB001]
MLQRRSAIGLALALAFSALAPATFAAEVTHAMGVTSVPDHPLRVVALTNEATEDLLALGIVLIGAARSANSNPWYDHVAAQLADTKVIGEELAPELETIAALEPDLIIGNKRRHEKIYEQLSAIAPTVFAENIQGKWKENFSLYAEAVGKVEEGKAVLAGYEDHARKVREALGDETKEAVTLVRFLAGQTYVYSNDSFSGVMIREAGLNRPAVQDREGMAELITKERIGELDADRIFYFNYEMGDGDANKQAEEWMAEPLWQNLAAVKAGHVYPVSDTIWATAGGIMAANLALDDVARIYELKLQ